MNERQKARVEDEILILLSELLLRRVKDPRVKSVSLTRVEASRDYSVAKVFYNVVGSDQDLDEVQRGLESSRKFMRSQIARRLRLRTVPELIFRYDRSLDRAMRIEELIDEIHREEERRSQAPSEDEKDDDR